MTVTQKGSGSKLKSLADAPLADTEQRGPDTLVVMQMLVSAHGYNSGETARFKSDVAAQMIDRGEAAVVPNTKIDGGEVGKALTRALSLVRRATDAQKEIVIQIKAVKEAMRAAEEAVENVYVVQASKVDNFTGAREALISAHSVAGDSDLAAAEEAVGVVMAANKKLADAKKAAKKAEDQDAAQEVVDKAESVAEAAKQILSQIRERNEVANDARQQGIIVATEEEEKAIAAAKEMTFPELDAALEKYEAAGEIDEDSE